MSIGQRLDHGHIRPHRRIKPADCGGPESCPMCRIERRLVDTFPRCDWWEVRGEQVCRGRELARDIWTYVMLGAERLVFIELTAELLDCVIGGEPTILRMLADKWATR